MLMLMKVWNAECVCSPTPRVEVEPYHRNFMLVAGVMHNVFACLVFIGYVMANHPQLPDSFHFLTEIRCVLTARRISCAIVKR